MSVRAMNKAVRRLLAQNDFAAALPAILALPRQAAIKALFSCLCHHQPLLRWHAVSAMGAVVAALANQDLEAARVVIRRMMWSLNDESGGIGWGIPEALAECLACHPGLAREYTHILVSFMREDGFFLEYEPLQRGLMWGLGRLAQVRPELLREKQAGRYLPSYLRSPDPTVRSLAARALGLLRIQEAVAAIRPLTGSDQPVTLYQDGELLPTSEGLLAGQALAMLAADPGRLPTSPPGSAPV